MSLIDDNMYENTGAYQKVEGSLRCPICGGIVKGDAPDEEYWFNCKPCGERFCLEDGELITLRERSNRHNNKKCLNCGQSLKGEGYIGAWEDGNNSDGYIECPHCGHVNFL